ncbi:MAG TPA: hypothetical protein VI756_19085 [Blastocatellia bacterium]
MSTHSLWVFLPVGYLVTVLIETPVLIVGLSSQHSLGRKIGASLWLNACSYPVVILVLPIVLAGAPSWVYIAVAETFAPVSECLLFVAAFYDRASLWRREMWRDVGAVTAANLASFLIGELLISLGVFARFFGPS